MAELTALDEDDFRLLCEELELGELQDYQHIEHSNKNTGYRLDTSRGVFFVKVIDEAYIGDVRAEIRIINFLADRGVKVAPFRGDPIVIKDKPVVVQDFVDGELVEDFSPEQLRNVAKAAADMQLALADCPIEIRTHWTGATRFDAFFEPDMLPDDVRGLASELEPCLKGLASLPAQLVHGDIHEYNVLMNGNDVVAILDFDICMRDLRCKELSVIVSSSCHTDNSWDEEKIIAAVESFTEVIPYSREELLALEPLVTRRMIQNIVWLKKFMIPRHPEKSSQFSEWIDMNVALAKKASELSEILSAIVR